MSAPTADELEAAVVLALKAHDMPAVVALVQALVAVDPRRGALVYDQIKLGIAPHVRAVIDAAAGSERRSWLETCTGAEREQLLRYLIGWDPATFDQARSWVERIRTGAKA